MPEPGEIDVAHVARLARLNLTDEETRVFQDQLRRILEYAEKLLEPDTSQLEIAAHSAPGYDVFREDEARAWLNAAEALSNAPRQANDLFMVTKVVE
jgi:aspartyl-tRNA(Asn)/glutamyl-tRNA(Gln) amidotransferase subunit C